MALGSIGAPLLVPLLSLSGAMVIAGSLLAAGSVARLAMLWRIDAQVGGRQEDIDLLQPRTPVRTDVRDRARAAGPGRPADHHGR